MQLFSAIGYVAGAFGVLAAFAAMYAYYRGAASKATIQAQEELIKTLMLAKEEQAEQIKSLHDKHEQSLGLIGSLQGQVDVLSKIPLKEISRDLAEVSTAQKAILEMLQAASRKPARKR